MDKISDLIKEAKPLYFQEKRNRKRIKTAFIGVFAVFLFTAGAILTVDLNSQNIIAQYNVSIVEEMGFDVDEYGFLKVE